MNDPMSRIEQIRSILVSCIRKFFPRKQDHEDLVQEAFLKLVKMDADSSTWSNGRVRTALKRRRIDGFRRRKGWQEKVMPWLEDSEGTENGRAMIEVEIEQALRTIPASRWNEARAFIAKECCGQTIKEIAEQEGVDPSTVRNRIAQFDVWCEQQRKSRGHRHE